MRLHYKYPFLFSLVMTLGMIIGYNIHSSTKVSTIPIDVFDTIEKHYNAEVNASMLELRSIEEVLSQLDSSSKIQKVVDESKSSVTKSQPSFTFYKIDSETVYVKLSSISAGAYRIFAKNLDSITSNNIKKITFDLRGANGDAFDDAIQIADEFLSEDKLITYTKGAHELRKEFRAKRFGLFEQGELNVLIDSLTRGPSEIICAAIKYWKRGKLIGTRTSGSATGMSKFFIGDNYEVMIPTVRYYSPNGQSITKLNTVSNIGGITPDTALSAEGQSYGISK